MLPMKKYKSDIQSRFKPCKKRAEKRRKGVGVCLEVKNGQRLLEEFLLLVP